ncbi:PREDICTED: N-acetyltransferase ESCO2 [Ficedula albicollis]|uniref:N-acetyltransferase ESCO2 n=1 Tax=Ficedula albicollis TaxID=59894 RepID=UPI0007AD9309|nr:PREDICTED: N-acetyltransferase ESCO2 [Ficedula albicollis]
MAEVALRSCGTPQKRSRDPDGSCSEFQTPVSKRLRAFPGSPSQNSRRNSREKLLASQIQWSPSSEEENQENEIFPRKPAPSRRLDIPEGNPGIPGNSQPGSASSHNSPLPGLRKRPEFRVLSAGVRPALRLQLGSAFFQSGKRSRKNPGSAAAPSGKNPGDSKNPPEKNPEKSGKAEKSGLEEEEEEKEAGEEEKENQECSAGFGNEGEEEIPRKSLGNSEAAEGKEQESPGIPPSPSPDSQNSGPKKELGSPCPAGLFPIFLPTRRRPLEELPAPFGIDPSGKAPRKSKESSQHSLDQMIIDAGQRQLGALQCGSCGMLYAPGIPEDRLQHLRHHRRLREGLRYLGWKKERVVAEFWDGKIVLILPGDPKYAIRKAQEVLALVDSELGFPTAAARCPEPSRQNSRISPERSRQNSRIFPAQSHVYLFVSPGNGVLGCLVAQGISQAFRVLPEPGSAPFPAAPQEDSRQDSRLGPVPVPVPVAVAPVFPWFSSPVFPMFPLFLPSRRSFMFGAVLSPEDLAFSDPTPDGRGFAARYCGRADFLVYNLLQGGQGSASSGPA